MDKRSVLFIIMRPNPLGTILTVALILTIQSHYEYLQTIALGTAYFLLLNSTFNLEKVNLREKEILTSSFLLSFAKALRRSSPETAFMRALSSETILESRSEILPKSGSESRSNLRSCSESKLESKTNFNTPQLVSLIGRIRNGVPLSEALKRIKGMNDTGSLLPYLLSDLLSFSSEEASKRIRNYARYRKEKEKIKSALSVKLAVVSLRFRVLSLICSSSLAVIAFASPILYSIAGLNWIGTSLGAYKALSFDNEIIAPCLSSVIFSTYAYSKLLPDVNGLKLSIASALVFLATEVALLLIIGWRI
ncbi:MAG: hypothetical protein N3D12_05625 [Candidatus Methanomethyliaceae archaeon]|nr:hypothetical protein [Candidatus Methanomethyliaceae archaeon]